MFAKNRYEAYNAGGDPATANKNYQGLPCPTWDALPENVRTKWQAAEDSDRGSFGWALRRLEEGKRVSRRIWPKNAWVEGYEMPAPKVVKFLHIFLDGVAQQWGVIAMSEILAMDWFIVTEVVKGGEENE